MSPVIAVIGAGNMGSCLIEGLIAHGHPCTKLWAADPNSESLQHLEETFHVITTIDNNKAVSQADIVILAVKPQKMESVLAHLASTIANKAPLVISIAAGVPIKYLMHTLGKELPIIRAMPNTPALIGAGVTVLCANDNVTPEQKKLSGNIFKNVSVTVWLQDENLMDVVTALSGSGPAYFFLQMEALQDAAIALGLPEDTARLLTLQTGIGATRMALESGKPLSALRRHVTSPGGTTEKALSILEDHDFRGLFLKALEAGKDRSQELAAMLGENE